MFLDGILEPETRAPSLSVTRRQLRLENLFGSLSGDILSSMCYKGHSIMKIQRAGCRVDRSVRKV